jgi:hypothetical protein
MTNDDAQSDERDPFRLADDAPADLQQAAYALRAAHREYMSLTDQWELWKALTTDQELHMRLGSSEVTQAVLTMWHALLSAIVLGINQVVDSRPDSLNVSRAFNVVRQHAPWRRNELEMHFATRPVIICGDQRSEGETVALERMIQENGARRAVAAFDQKLEEFLAAKKRFTAGDADAALGRLRDLRRKEIAHNDLVAVLRERPKVHDLDLVFHALRDLLYSAILLCTGTHIDVRRDEQDARRVALCLSAVLRPETAEERATASARASGASG